MLQGIDIVTSSGNSYHISIDIFPMSMIDGKGILQQIQVNCIGTNHNPYFPAFHTDLYSKLVAKTRAQVIELRLFFVFFSWQESYSSYLLGCILPCQKLHKELKNVYFGMEY